MLLYKLDSSVMVYFHYRYGFTLLFVISLSLKLSTFFPSLKPRDSFPFDQQFNILMRFIVDQTQTPNLKVGNYLSLQFNLWKSNLLKMYFFVHDSCLAIMNKSAVSILVQLFGNVFPFLLVEYLEEKLLVYWVGTCLALF